MSGELLSRDEFRRAVFERDRERCVFCSQPAQDAHHILERRLWPDGGYYVDNGAAVCAKHHLDCEATVLSVEDVRAAAGITRRVVPPHLYADQPYDKWGNPVLGDGRRLRGELFRDGSVQKALARGGVLGSFTAWVKYPRTHHLPWSPGMTNDDRLIPSLDELAAARVVVTEKMDGECTSLYRDHIHARSVDGRSHPSRDWVKGLWGRIASDLPDGWRVCGENLFARHSIGYEGLPSYFLGFSIWTDQNECLGWDETLEWFELLGITPVPTLYDGPWNAAAIQALWGQADWERREGYVVRVARSFGYGQFRTYVGKFVRPGHVQTIKHWMHGQPMQQNGISVPR